MKYYFLSNLIIIYYNYEDKKSNKERKLGVI